MKTDKDPIRETIRKGREITHRAHMSWDDISTPDLINRTNYTTYHSPNHMARLYDVIEGLYGALEELGSLFELIEETDERMVRTDDLHQYLNQVTDARKALTAARERLGGE